MVPVRVQERVVQARAAPAAATLAAVADPVALGAIAPEPAGQGAQLEARRVGLPARRATPQALPGVLRAVLQVQLVMQLVAPPARRATLQVVRRELLVYRSSRIRPRLRAGPPSTTRLGQS